MKLTSVYERRYELIAYLAKNPGASRKDVTEKLGINLLALQRTIKSLEQYYGMQITYTANASMSTSVSEQYLHIQDWGLFDEKKFMAIADMFTE